MADPTDEQLRESARHRGLKLLKSRRRKPGGDFGLYGLADASGAPRFGMGEDGLTATAAEVASFLRKGDAATWADSVEATPTNPRPPRPAPKEEVAPEPERAVIRRPRPVPASDRPAEAQPTRPTPPPPTRPTRKPPAAEPPPPEPPPPPPPEPEPPKPVLTIRPAQRADAAALAALVPDTPAAVLAERLAAAAALGEPVLVADRDGVIGCLAWHVLPTLRHGPVVRITFLAVLPAEQRRGIGRRLVEHLADTAAARDLPLIEAISDIAIESTNGFFRRTGFAQTSYRFTRAPQP